MRATLIGRFLLIAILCLAALLPLWYWASPWLAKPPIWLAGHAMQALFPWVDGFEQHGVVATLLTKVQVRMQRGGADVLAELAPEASYPSYGYGLVLLWAMLIASHPHRWWLKGLIGTVILFPVQAWGLCFQWLRDVVLLSGPNGAAYLKYPQWAIDAVAYGYQFGFLNRILFTLGVITEPINWAGNPDTALFAITVPYVWRTLPFAILLVHAALQGINKELHEAAAVDGANAWRRFWHITLPLLTPIIVVILVLRTSFAFAVFEEILAITQGGPGDATWVAAWYSYRKSFAPPFDIGLGSASAYLLAMLVGILALVYVRMIYRRVE